MGKYYWILEKNHVKMRKSPYNPLIYTTFLLFLDTENLSIAINMYFGTCEEAEIIG
jgi:hypothetical protein